MNVSSFVRSQRNLIWLLNRVRSYQSPICDFCLKSNNQFTNKFPSTLIFIHFKISTLLDPSKDIRAGIHWEKGAWITYNKVPVDLSIVWCPQKEVKNWNIDSRDSKFRQFLIDN